MVIRDLSPAAEAAIGELKKLLERVRANQLGGWYVESVHVEETLRQDGCQMVVEFIYDEDGRNVDVTLPCPDPGTKEFVDSVKETVDKWSKTDHLYSELKLDEALEEPWPPPDFGL